MKIKILAFGIVKEIFGSSSIFVELGNEENVEGMKAILEAKYPELKNLRACMIAVNESYAEDNQIILPEDEIAIIPPVSGG